MCKIKRVLSLLTPIDGIGVDNFFRICSNLLTPPAGARWGAPSRATRFISFMIILTLTLFIADAAAQTYYVSTTGNNGNSGTLASPWRNIQYALNQVQSGDIVYVRGGTYNEYVVFEDSGITLRGYTGEIVILDGTGLNWRYGVDLQSYDNITVQNMTIQNYSLDGNYDGYGVVGWSDNDNITLKDLTISKVGAAIKFQANYEPPPPVASGLTMENITAFDYTTGIDLGPAAVQDVVIRNVSLTGPGGSGETYIDGIAVESGNNILVENAYVVNHPGDGIDLKANNVIVRGSTVLNQGRDGVKLWGTNTTLENSTITGSYLTGLVLEGSGPYNITNNSIGNTIGYGYLATLGPYDTPSPSQIILKNNIFFNQIPTNGGTLLYFSPGCNVTSQGNLFYQPYRIDAVIDATYSSQNSGDGDSAFGVSDFNAGIWPTGFTNNLYGDTAGIPYTIGNPTLQSIWVDPVSGNDGNSGNSRVQALRTISAAWNRIPQGLTLSTTGYHIRLTAGTYPENSTPAYWESRYGTYPFPIILEAVDGPGTALLPAINMYDCKYLYMIGLRIQAPGGDVLHYDACDHILLRSSYVTGSSIVQETLKANQCRYIYLEDNDISEADQNPIDFVACQNGHILNNKIHNGQNWCMYLKGGSSDILVDGNEIYACGGTGSDGGFLAGQGTGFEFMVTPWLHYEAYNIKFTNNYIHDSSGPGMGVNGGYNILMAYNTLYRVGSFSHGMEVAQGLRSCDGNTTACQSRNALGGWGPVNTESEQPIPSRNVFIYNNILYNPPGFESQWQHFYIAGPQTPSSGTNIPSPVNSDTNLEIRGNIIWNGPSDLPLGIEDGSGCQPSNSTCNETQLRAENEINSLLPQLDSNLRPVAAGNVFDVTTYALPNFSGTDRAQPPLSPQGNLTNIVNADRDNSARTSSSPPGAYTGEGSSSSPNPSVSLSADPTSRTINAGSPTTFTITLNRTNYTGAVDLSVTGLPLGISGNFNPASTAGTSSTLTVTTSPSVGEGNYTLSIDAAGTGISIPSSTVNLTVNVPDSDGDGLSDNDENNLGTDPNDPDSDDDFLNDGTEVSDGTDPLDSDSDDDEMNDYLEKLAGSDPNDSLDAPIALRSHFFNSSQELNGFTVSGSSRISWSVSNGWLRSSGSSKKSWITPLGLDLSGLDQFMISFDQILNTPKAFLRIFGFKVNLNLEGVKRHTRHHVLALVSQGNPYHRLKIWLDGYLKLDQLMQISYTHNTVSWGSGGRTRFDKIYVSDIPNDRILPYTYNFINGWGSFFITGDRRIKWKISSGILQARAEKKAKNYGFVKNLQADFTGQDALLSAEVLYPDSKNDGGFWLSLPFEISPRRIASLDSNILEGQSYPGIPVGQWNDISLTVRQGPPLRWSLKVNDVNVVQDESIDGSLQDFKAGFMSDSKGIVQFRDLFINTAGIDGDLTNE